MPDGSPTTLDTFWIRVAGKVQLSHPARTLAAQRGTTLHENVRLFALLNLAGADTAGACMDANDT
jgi:hypothetical protein